MSFVAYKNLGHLYQAKDHQVFFGNKNASLEILRKEFISLDFKRLRQTHSDVVQEITSSSLELGPEGDALWTSETKLALAINTADCLPILVHSPDLNRIAAIHAGWKGVENKITEKTLSQAFSGAKNLSIYIGPHILYESFEVDPDVKDRLTKGYQEVDGACFRSGAPGKFHVNLIEIVKKQLGKFSAVQTFHFKTEDTKTHSDYFSHRREPSNKGRQISFISKR